MQFRIAIAVITSLLLAFCAVKSHLIYQSYAPFTNYVGGKMRYYPKRELSESERIEVFGLMRQHLDWGKYSFLLAIIALPQYLQLIEIWYRKWRGKSLDAVRMW